MSTMEGNRHFAAAMEHRSAEWVQAKATLALAYEQRTATLVAFYATIPEPRLDTSTVSLRNAIMDRLGL